MPKLRLALITTEHVAVYERDPTTQRAKRVCLYFNGPEVTANDIEVVRTYIDPQK